MIVDRRLYLTRDRNSLVEEGDPRAAFLYCAPGQYVNAEHFLSLQVLPKVEVIPEAKAMAAPAENKALEIPTETKRHRPRLLKRRKV